MRVRCDYYAIFTTTNNLNGATISDFFLSSTPRRIVGLLIYQALHYKKHYYYKKHYTKLYELVIWCVYVCVSLM